MNRRQVLALAAGGTIGTTAGCLDNIPFIAEESELKPDSWDDHCPGAGPLDVDWPEELDRSTVRSFVHDYEFRYMRDVFHEFDPFLEDRYDTDIDVTDVSRVGDGYEASVSTRASTLHGTLQIIASKADDIEAEPVIPVEDIPTEHIYWDGDSVSEALKSESQPASAISPPREAAEQFAELSTEFDDPEMIIDHTIYVDVDGTLYELNFEYSSSGLIGDMWRDVEYYVDDIGLVIEWGDEETIIQCREV